MNGLTGNDLGCRVRWKKNPVRCLIDADCEFLKNASCYFRTVLAAGSDVVGRLALWARDARRLKCHSESS